MTAAGVKVDLPYVQAYRDRHGRERYYFRRKGFPRVALPDPQSDEFRAAYDTANVKEPRVKPSAIYGEKTFGALCVEFLNSSEFDGLAPSTQREVRYRVDRLMRKHADKRVETLARKHILRWRDEMKKTPGEANTQLRVIKWLMRFAVDREYRKDNPTIGIKLLKAGSFRAWDAPEMEAFEERWPLGTLERTGYALALYTGQRRADLVKLKWKHIAGKAVRLTQQKTGTALEIPLHPKLQEALAAVNPRHETAILTGEKNTALNAIYFGAIMASAIAAAGLPDDCVLHGLRKSAARALIDAGCTPHQAAAVTGHKTIRMLEEYARGANQKKLAGAAIAKWGRKRRTK
jgi:enterobacteria phage integrase